MSANFDLGLSWVGVFEPKTSISVMYVRWWVLFLLGGFPFYECWCLTAHLYLLHDPTDTVSDLNLLCSSAEAQESWDTTSWSWAYWKSQKFTDHSSSDQLYWWRLIFLVGCSCHAQSDLVRWLNWWYIRTHSNMHGNTNSLNPSGKRVDYSQSSYFNKTAERSIKQCLPFS